MNHSHNKIIAGAELVERFEACILAGAIGDAWGSSLENQAPADTRTLRPWGVPKKEDPLWAITDDTQLTLATCEALDDPLRFSPEVLSAHFVDYFKRGKITGAGGSTLKALVELEAGIDWSHSGRSGEYAAGNGAAMRIAPLAYFGTLDRESIMAVCRITHRNDEAYVGALAVVISIQLFISGEWDGGPDLFKLIIPLLPDSRVRDRLIEIESLGRRLSIEAVSGLGTRGYVVHSVPFALFAASRVKEIGIRAMYERIIAAGGDTDTNASIAGHVAGTVIGLKGLPADLQEKLASVRGYEELRTALQHGKNALRRMSA